MAQAKIETANRLKSVDGDASIDTLIRQTIGKEPFYRTNESSFQLNQLLCDPSAIMAGWPVYPPMKIQMQKCGKCSREFCSTINYRRHLRLHRRKLNPDKDSATKYRGLLQSFWDKLSVEEAMEIMSLDEFLLGVISGSLIVKTLASFIRKSVYTSLPQSYVKSGGVLLDLVQGRPTRFPVSSQDLFDVLDEASENTFLCAGTAELVQKFVFNGDAGQIGLEMRNLIACTSFLVEQKLVKACLAYKDAESLRYQKLLVDEEEAAQKRQAALMEKKRLKKLRQKEQRAKELPIAGDDDSPEKSPPSSSSSNPADDNDAILEILEIPPDATAEHSQPLNGDVVEDQENRHPDLGTHQKGCPDSGTHQNFEHKKLHRDGQRQVVNYRWQAPKSHRYLNGFHTSHNNQVPKPGVGQKRAASRNSHTATNGTKVWSVKPKSETSEGSPKPISPIETPKPPCQERQLLIGSIPVPLGNHSILGHIDDVGFASESSALELPVPRENGDCQSPALGNRNQGTANCSAVTLLRVSRPVIQHHNELVQPTDVVESTSNGVEDKSDSFVEDGYQGGFSSHLAEAFLSQRWKEAITADHVELVLFSDGPPIHSVAQDGDNQEATLSPESDESIARHTAENHSQVYMTIGSSATVKSKTRAKSKKGSIVK
ncbi:hypothetical protein vseg_011881 [Gypsophila vaccaria]